MPKMKTHSGAKKRFEITRTGKIRRRKAFLNHILEKKSADRKRRLGRMALVSPADAKNVRKMLGK
jgi:large subunit ribosomal protein L35